MTDDRVRGRRPPHGDPVLDRAFKILACFTPADRKLSPAALSARTGLPKTTTLRLAAKLTALGALERTPDGHYSVGLRLLEVASLAPRGHGLRAAALPYMQDLHHATRQHVLLAVRDGHEAVLVDRLSGRGAGRVLYRVGGRMPLHSTGVGLILLAHAPCEVQDQVLATRLQMEPEHAQMPARELRTRLAAVRHDGVAVISRPQPEPMTSVATAITDQAGHVAAALSVVTRSQQVEPAILIPAVIAVARAVSRALSHMPG